jgi:peptide chain release factor 3
MEVCRMRNTPVMIFVNKLDRPGKDPFDLLDELETKLNIKVRPLSWPINMGSDFKGCTTCTASTSTCSAPTRPASKPTSSPLIRSTAPPSTR